MRRLFVYLSGLAVAFCLSPVATFAQHGHGAGGGGGHGALGVHGHETSEGRAENRAPDAGRKTPDELLARNNKLSERLQALLPPHTNIQDAAKGFKNLGQFVAAVHVSHNLDIPFDQLKSMMTGSHHDSLGTSIRTLKPDVDAKSEAKKAKQEADDDIRESNS